MAASVVNVRKNMLQVSGYRDLEHWLEDPNHVYVGRDMTRYVPGAVGSVWGNPFPSAKHGLEECLRRYEEHIVHSGHDLEQLRGKVLGCWCKPNACHGDVLVRLLEKSASATTSTTTTTTPTHETPPDAQVAPKKKKKSRLQ